MARSGPANLRHGRAPLSDFVLALAQRADHLALADLDRLRSRWQLRAAPQSESVIYSSRRLDRRVGEPPTQSIRICTPQRLMLSELLQFCLVRELSGFGYEDFSRSIWSSSSCTMSAVRFRAAMNSARSSLLNVMAD